MLASFALMVGFLLNHVKPSGNRLQTALFPTATSFLWIMLATCDALKEFLACQGLRPSRFDLSTQGHGFWNRLAGAGHRERWPCGSVVMSTCWIPSVCFCVSFDLAFSANLIEISWTYSQLTNYEWVWDSLIMINDLLPPLAKIWLRFR